MPKKSGKKYRKLSVQEKQKRKVANLLKNKINLVEFVSQYRKVKKEPPDDAEEQVDTKVNIENFDMKIETKEVQLSDYDEYETSDGYDNELDENSKRTLRSDFERARQRIYSKRWRQKPENQQKIKIYKMKIREKLKEAKKIAKLEQAKYREAAKHAKKIKITKKC